MASPLDNQLVKVRNLGDKTLSGAFGGQPYSIPPGEEVFMEVECAKKDYGDWDLRNLHPTEDRLRFRVKEYARVRGLYGVTPGAKIPILKDGEPVFNAAGVPEEVLADQVWRERVPKVAITRMDGTPCVTVLDDPEGKDLPAAESSSEDKDLALAEMQSQLRKLQESMEAMQGSKVSIPVDDPETAPRPVAKKAKAVAAQTVSE